MQLHLLRSIACWLLLTGAAFSQTPSYYLPSPAQSILTNGPQIQLMQATDPLSASGIPRRFQRIKIEPTP